MRISILLIALSIILGCSSSNTDDNVFTDEESNSIYSEDAEVLTNNSEENSYDESMPASQYFRVEEVREAYFLEDGRCVLEIDVRNIYSSKFSTFYLGAATYVKLKNNEEYCRMTSVIDTDIKKEFYKIVDWQPNEIKTLKINSPEFNSLANRCYYYDLRSFDRTPEEIYIEFSCNAISIEDEPEGVFARFDLMDLWKSKQVDLGISI